MTTRPGSGTDSLAGYRVVRRLGVGSRADAYLAVGSTGTVVLKVFRDDVAEEGVGTELDALSRIDSPHVVRLLDVSSAARGLPILILERVRRGSVALLLRDRDSLERGEVVTLLAPIAAALPKLHRAGVGHQGIAASSIHIGSAGEPVLLGFGHCELFAKDASIAAIEAEPAATEDRIALARLATTLLTHVRDSATDQRVIRLIEWIEAAPSEYEFPELLASRLFDFADPLPIEFGREPNASTVPARIGSPDRESRVQPIPRTDEPIGSRPSGVLEALTALLADSPVEVARERLIRAARGVRKPFWVAAGAVVIAFIVVIAVLPSAPTHPATATRARAIHTPKVIAPTAPALPDDPVLALPILLTARTNCIKELSVLCLNDVDEASSSAYSADAALIEQLQGGSEIPASAIVAAATPSLIELLGDSALVSLGPNSDPASVLMIKDEAGWRIRGYLSGVQATGSPAVGGNS